MAGDGSDDEGGPTAGERPAVDEDAAGGGDVETDEDAGIRLSLPDGFLLKFLVGVVVIVVAYGVAQPVLGPAVAVVAAALLAIALDDPIADRLRSLR